MKLYTGMDLHSTNNVVVIQDEREGKTVRLRCVTTPDEAQKVLLNRLGLTIPQRLRYIEEVNQM